MLVTEIEADQLSGAGQQEKEVVRFGVLAGSVTTSRGPTGEKGVPEKRLRENSLEELNRWFVVNGKGFIL